MARDPQSPLTLALARSHPYGTGIAATCEVARAGCGDRSSIG
jgi:hypothetical protein